MLTPFGKICRKIRIDRGELLKDMAQVLGVTPSYLSAVEKGKRNIPEDWVNVIARKYQLDQKGSRELVKARNLSQSYVNMPLRTLEEKDRETALAFARDFGGLSEDEKRKIRAIFNKRGDFD